MRGLKIFGDYVMEFLVITLIVILSAATVIFFVPALVGLCGYFRNKKDVRLFRDIFKTMKENWKILIPYTIFQLVMLVFPILNIYYFNTHLDKMNYVILAVSYVALVIGAIYLTTAPTIIVNMNVTFLQLLFNGFMLLFGSLLRSIIALALIGGVIALILLFPYVVVVTLYFVPLFVSKLMLENFYVLKARVLKTNVYTVKNQEIKDDYLDETGQVKHEKKKEEVVNGKN